MLVTYVFQLLALGVVTLLYLLKRFVPLSSARNDHKRVPGPWGLPWLGPIWAIDATSIYKTFLKWSQQYGSLYQVTIFGQNFVVVSDPNIAKQILATKGAIASDRPSIALLDNSKASGKYLPFLGHNELFHKQRKFGVSLNLYSHQNNYHDRIVPEIKLLLAGLARKEDSYDRLLNKCCARIACSLSFAETRMAAEISRNSHTLMRNLSPGGRITNVLTFLRWLPSSLSGEKFQEARRRLREANIWTGAFHVAKARHEAGKLKPCYARYYLEHQRKLQLCEQDAIYGIGMMLTVSILTITAPTLRFIVALTMHPVWQTAVQVELDEVVGHRMVTLKDSPNLPVLRAVLLESMRWTSPLPTGIPHRLEAEIEYSGYKIKQGTNIMACDWAMARNPNLYDDPDTFNPNRYLDPSSPVFRSPLTEFPRIQGHHAFGFGRRICVGQDQAASETFLLCGNLLWAFKLRPAVNSRTGQAVRVEVGGATPHVIPIPFHQDIVFECRDEGRRQLVLQNELSADSL